MYLDAQTHARPATAEAAAHEHLEGNAPVQPQASALSRLFATLVSTVDRRRLLVDRAYFSLVSEIAELLSDDEVALLALYFAPPLAIGMPSRERRLARSIMRERKTEKPHA